MTWMVAVLAGTAAYLAGGPRRRLPRATADPTAVDGPARFLATATAAGVVTVLVLGLRPSRIVLAAVLLASAADVARRFARRRRRHEAARRAGHVLATCDALAADLRAGLPPTSALDGAVAGWPEFAPVARAARFGADVPGALRALATLPGAGRLRVVAAAWQVAHRTGAGLASALELAGRTLREDAATAEVVATELAAARATATLLAVLPVAVLALGSGVGGDPVGFLLATTPGLCCLAGGLLLSHLGLAWLDAIAAGVEP